MDLEPLLQAFAAQFGGEPALIASAPGRVNLIGEHTDYMEGLVLPMAIDRELLFAARPNGGKTIRGYSVNFGERVEFPLGEYDARHPCRWLRYVLGVLREARQEAPQPEGFDFCVAGNVPIGAGLSSSATFLVAVLTAAESLYGFKLGRKEAALLCQRAENDFVGVQCGIMDPFISLGGRSGHALRIDCRDLSAEAVPAAVPGHAWMVVDSRKKRGLVDSEYNLRFLQCLDGLRGLKALHPDRAVDNVRDLTPEEVAAARGRLNPVSYRRVLHVASENLRVDALAAALRAGDLDGIGRNLYASHRSLREDYEVSCEELDTLVDLLAESQGVVGARLTGAGFGGCAIALIREDALAATAARVGEAYRKKFPATEPAEFWPVRASDGAGLLESRLPLRATG